MTPLFPYRLTLLALISFSLLPNMVLAQPLSVSLQRSDYSGYAISCFGEKDGSITAQITGGVPPYRFGWSTGEEDSLTISGLPAGYYVFKISDDAGADAYAEIILLEPNAMKVGLSPVVYPNDYNISCWDCHNGIIYVDVHGGTSPFSYLWNDGLSGAMRTGLGAKQQYSVEVTDANGCTAKTQKINLTQPERNDWGMQGNSGTDPATHFIGTSDSKDLVFKSNNAERLRLKSNGALRLAGLSEGVMLLNSDFEIVTATARKPWCWPDNPDLTPWYVCGNDLESDAVHFLGTVNDKALNFRTNNIHRMSIMRDGKVHIGEFTQTPPANSPYLLFVEGGIATRDVMVKLGTWPDYVFADNYRLMPLSELRDFLKRNKHLPGIPSAATLEEQGGVAVGEMQRNLVRTVEEQALYILQLEHRLELMEQRLKGLEASK